MTEEVIIDCPSCGEAMSLDVEVGADPEQSVLMNCPSCSRSLEVFIRCQDGEVLSVSVSTD